jgi:hypothetical protein
LAVDSTAGFDTVFNNVERNTILLVDSTEYDDTKQWDLKMPNIFVATFEIKGAGSSFNFRNTSNGDATVGYTLTFSGTTLTLKYDDSVPILATATIPNLDATYGKVYLTYEKQYFTVTVDGTRVLSYKDTGTRTFPDGEYINFFAGTGTPRFQNLKVVAGHLISDGTSNVSLYGGLAVTSNLEVGQANLFVDTTTSRVGVGTTTPEATLHVSGNAYVSSNLEVGSSNLFVDTVNSRVGVGTDTPKESLDVVGNMHLTRVSNVSQIKVDSNVVTEYTGPHDRPLRKYPEIILPRAAVGADYNGYRIERSSEYVTGPYLGVQSLFNNTAVDYADTWGAGINGTNFSYSASTGEHTAYVTGGTTQGTAARLASNVPNGEWVSLKSPNAIKLDNIQIRSRNASDWFAQFPTDFQIWGSNDGTTWSHIKTFTGQSASGQSILHTYHINSTIFYNRHALVVTKIPGETSSGANDGAAHLSISELRFNGHEEGSGSLDTTLKSVYNVPATTGTQLEVYYDGQDFSGTPTSITDRSTNTITATANNITIDTTYNSFEITSSPRSNIIADNVTFVSGDEAHTYALWVRLKNSKQRNLLIDYRPDGGTATTGNATGVLIDDYNQRIQFYHQAADVETRYTFTTNVWYHIICSYSGGGNNTVNSKIYINGVEQTNTHVPSGNSTSTLTLPTTGKLTIGDYLYGGDYGMGDGNIGNVRLYSKALNADQIKELYDYQKDYFLGSKSQVTLYKGHLGVGVTEPSGQLELAGDERIQEYPPRGMTGWETYMEGHGVFRAGKSGHDAYLGSWDRWKVFNKGFTASGGTTGDAYHGEQSYSSSTGLYTGSESLGGIFGDYFILDMPYKISLKHINVTSANQNRSPTEFIILGSNDGSTWTQIKNFSSAFTGSGQTLPFQVNSTEYFSYFGLVVTKIVASDGYLMLSEWQLFGTPGPTTLDKGSLTLGRSLDVPRISRYDVDTETPRPEKLVVDYDTTVNSSPTDISGQGNHGTFRDSSGAPSYSPADKAFNFSGVNGVIVSGALSPAMTGDRICSMSCWFKTTDAANNNTQTLMWLGAYSGQGFIGLLIQNNQLKLTIGSERAIKTTSSPIQSNQWYHVVAIKSGTGQINSSTANGYFQIYINGEKSTDTTFQNQTGTLNITTNYLYLGAGGVSGQEPLNGYISNPKLYNVALEPSEVKKLYNLGRTGRSMVISDTAVGIGKVPEANLDVRGSLAVRGSLVLPTLTTFDSITGLTGMIRFNTAMATLQVHNGSTWVTINGVSATGGTISNADGYVIHTFTNVSDTFTMLSSGNIEYLVVAGGGGGGTGGATAHEAGGGGAGGLLSGTISNLPPGSYTVTVGGGGAAMSNGTNSSINFPTTITAIGGGKGDGGASGGGNGGGNGGSGGGGRYNTAGGNGTSGQGNDGSGGAYYMGTSGTYSNSGGGGGGAGQAGGQGGVTDGGNGVQFTYYNHKGSPAGWFAGGGRGAVVSSGTHPSWTAYGGGGSPNSVNNSGNTTAGVANTGGGGGGSWSSTSSVVGGAGGSGIVIIRYLS